MLFLYTYSFPIRGRSACVSAQLKVRERYRNPHRLGWINPKRKVSGVWLVVSHSQVVGLLLDRRNLYRGIRGQPSGGPLQCQKFSLLSETVFAYPKGALRLGE